MVALCMIPPLFVKEDVIKFQPGHGPGRPRGPEQQYGYEKRIDARGHRADNRVTPYNVSGAD